MKLTLHLLLGTVLVFLSAVQFLCAENADSKQTTDSKPAATVVGITGKWKLVAKLVGNLVRTLPKDCRPEHGEKVEELHFGSCFDFDTNSKPVAVGKGGSLVIMIDGKNTSYPCDHPDKDLPPDLKNEGFVCVREIVSPNKPPGFISRQLAAAMLLFTESPARYITPVTRGLEAELADSVVQLQGDRVDLAPVLQEMDTGRYRLRLESLAGSAWTSGPVQLQWSGGGPAPVPIPGVKPGLYRLERLTADGESAGSDAWVLVSSPDRFAKDSAAVRSAVEETKKWPDDVDARAPRTLLRAYLDSLSRQAKAEQ